VGGSRLQRAQIGAGGLQPLEFDLSTEIAVTDVVDPTGEGVDRAERVAFGSGQQPDAVGEIAGLFTGDAHTVVVCLLRPHRASPMPSDASREHSMCDFRGRGVRASTSNPASTSARAVALPPAT